MFGPERVVPLQTDLFPDQIAHAAAEQCVVKQPGGQPGDGERYWREVLVPA